MCTPKPKQESKSGPLVEDTTVVGGTDDDGNAVIKPKPVGGLVTEDGFEPTDPQERAPSSDA